MASVGIQVCFSEVDTGIKLEVKMQRLRDDGLVESDVSRVSKTLRLIPPVPNVLYLLSFHFHCLNKTGTILVSARPTIHFGEQIKL